jgi:hypothetical protein
VKKAEKLRNAVRLPNPPFKGIQQTYLIQWLPIHKSLHAMALTPIIYIYSHDITRNPPGDSPSIPSIDASIRPFFARLCRIPAFPLRNWLQRCC